jgi:molybdopterin biosynthesis enzyme
LVAPATLLTAVTSRAGGQLCGYRAVADDEEALRRALDAVDGDVVVVTGASSAGAADHLHSVLDRRHVTWYVDGVACRPCHPQALAATLDGRWIVSLPGNPYAGLVAALTLLEPLLASLAGRRRRGATGGAGHRPGRRDARRQPDRAGHDGMRRSPDRAGIAVGKSARRRSRRRARRPRLRLASRPTGRPAPPTLTTGDSDVRRLP